MRVRHELEGNTPLERWRNSHVRRKDSKNDTYARWVDSFACIVLVLIMLFMLIGSSPMQHGTSIDPSNKGEVSPINRYLWLGLLGLAGPILWFRWSSIPGLIKAVWPLFLLYLWFAFTTLWAIDNAASVRRLLLYFVALVLACAMTVGIRSARSFHGSIAVACAIVMIMDLLAWILVPSLSMTALGLAGIHPHKNTLGVVALFSYLILASYALGYRSRLELAIWSSLALLSLILMNASQSKTSLALALGMTALAPALIYIVRAPAAVPRLVAVFILLLLTAALFIWLGYTSVAGIDPLSPLAGVTFTQRTEVWSFIISQIKLRPWGGFGFGSFWDVAPSVQPSLKTGKWFATGDSIANEGHNAYLDITVTTGFIGLFGSMVLLIRWLWLGLKLLRTTPINLGDQTTAPRDLPLATFCAIYMLMFAIHNFTESSYFTANTILGSTVLFVVVKLEYWNLREKQARPSRLGRRTPTPRVVLRGNASTGQS